ncbi:MAG: protein kinase [Myxococcota bacterium]|nr:protein kinase [Myxococcota bacterium]
MKICPHCSEPVEPTQATCLACGHAILGDPNADPWLNREIAGRYRIESKLGDGGMGEVYRAVQTAMARPIALKILNDELAQKPSQVERFKREAQAASQLTHPNTIVVHDFGQCDDGTLFIAMEYLEGMALAEVLNKSERLEPRRLVNILAQVCDSLQEAHDQQVVHRDLKPENIFLTSRGDEDDFAKVLDFGIAKLTKAPDGQMVDRLTRAGTLCGTPHYMAPEQIRDETVDWRADIYALGVLIYYTLAQKEPFDADKLVDVLTMHLHKDPPAIDWGSGDVDPAYFQLESVARLALSKDREDRPQSARELKMLLRATLNDQTQLSTFNLTPSSPEKKRLSGTLRELFKVRKNRRWAIGFGFVFLCILVGHLSESDTPQSSQTIPVPRASQSEPSERHQDLVQDVLKQLQLENETLRAKLMKKENESLKSLLQKKKENEHLKAQLDKLKQGTAQPNSTPAKNQATEQTDAVVRPRKLDP